MFGWYTLRAWCDCIVLIQKSRKSASHPTSRSYVRPRVPQVEAQTEDETETETEADAVRLRLRLRQCLLKLRLRLRMMLELMP